MNALSVVSRSYWLIRPEVPGKSQRTPTGRSHSFGSVQGMRVRCGLVIVDRRSDPNERQRALLERLAAGEEHPAAWSPGDWRSAYALRDRGLLGVSRSGREALVCRAREADETDTRVRRASPGRRGTNRSPEVGPHRQSDIRTHPAPITHRLAERPAPIFPPPWGSRSELEYLTCRAETRHPHPNRAGGSGAR